MIGFGDLKFGPVMKGHVIFGKKSLDVKLT